MNSDSGLTRLAILGLLGTLAACASMRPAAAQPTADYQQVFQLAGFAPLTIEFEALSADVEIFYSHDGEVTITGTAQASNSAKLDNKFFKSVLSVELMGNHLKLRHIPDRANQEPGTKVRYRIDVPYRTEVISRVNQGTQTISGIMGPVSATTKVGDIRVSYVSKGLQIDSEVGDISLHVIGEHANVKTGSGYISCEQVPLGVNAETGEGDISLMVVGPSNATIRRGKGRIDVGGARGSFTGVTAEGDLHVKAIPRDHWQLSSISGNIRLELPPKTGFELDASTETGELQLNRDGLTRRNSGASQFHLNVNGGGPRIIARSLSGNIAVR